MLLLWYLDIVILNSLLKNQKEKDTLMTTKRAEPPAPTAPASETTRAAPRGIGTAVAFDWGLTAEFLWLAPLLALGISPGDMLAHAALGVRLLGTAVILVLAGVTFALGEGVRRGNRLIWLAQIGINILIFLGGFGTIPSAVESLRAGHIGGLTPTLIMLLVSPTAAWLLTRKQTRQWIAETTSEQARSRHGGSWVWKIALIAALGGAAVTFAGFY